MKNNNIIEIIKNDGVGILPTDTLYGIVGSALSPKAVEKIYNLKNRDEKKSLIILIPSLDSLKTFGVEISDIVKKFIEKYWPGKISIILHFDNKKFNYLDRMDGTLAFRFPDKKDLIELLKETGPLVAPSANPEGMAPAKNIEEAKKYFGDKIDFYIDGGEIESEPSTLVKIEGDKIEILRKGAVTVML